MRITPTELMAKNRKRPGVIARHALAYFLRKHTVFSYEYIGAIMGKHHATIIHSVKFINDYSVYDPYLRTIKESIDHLVKSDHFSLREEVMHCLKAHTGDNTRTEAILILLDRYCRAEVKASQEQEGLLIS
jgi:chromosomal replication initiation ATPase DnaA